MPSKLKPSAGLAQPAATTDAPRAPTRWIVTIPFVPSTVVEAIDEADAWERFKAKWGIIKSEHVPSIFRNDPSSPGDKNAE
jgi:hypothetical protein